VVTAGRTEELAKPRGVEVDVDGGTRHYDGVGREDVPRIVAELVGGGEKVYGVRVLTSTLEEIYLEAVEGESS
jgi:ABC-2 type transport system ATP-binding protein